VGTGLSSVVSNLLGQVENKGISVLCVQGCLQLRRYKFIILLGGTGTFLFVLWLSGVIFPSYPEGSRSWLVGSEWSKFYLVTQVEGHNFNVYLKLLGNSLRGRSFEEIKGWLDERFEYDSEAPKRDIGQMLWELYAYGKVKGVCGDYATILYWLEEVTHPELEKRVAMSDDHAWLEVKLGDGWVPVERGYPIWVFKFINHHLFDSPKVAFNRYYLWKF